MKIQHESKRPFIFSLKQIQSQNVDLFLQEWRLLKNCLASIQKNTSKEFWTPKLRTYRLRVHDSLFSAEARGLFVIDSYANESTSMAARIACAGCIDLSLQVAQVTKIISFDFGNM